MTFSYSPFRFWNRGTTGGSALPVGAGATNDFFGHATSWYIEKLGLQKVPAEMDDPEGCVALGFSKKDQTCIAVIGPLGKPTDGTTPMLYASSIRKAREVLSSSGVNVGEIQEDRQGTHYFEMRDVEGNVIEISEEP